MTRASWVSPNVSSDEGRQRPDRDDEPEPGVEQAAPDRSAFEVALLALLLGRLDDREQVAGEQCAAERQRQVGEEVVAEEHPAIMAEHRRATLSAWLAEPPSCELFERSSSTLHFDDGTHATAVELLDGRPPDGGVARRSEGVRRATVSHSISPTAPSTSGVLLACAVGRFRRRVRQHAVLRRRGA